MMRRIAAAIRNTDWMDEADQTDETPDMLDTMSALISQSLELNAHLEES